MQDFIFSVAVTGTHGKTTTSAIVAHIAEKCGKDPTVIVGGEMALFGGNAKSGCGDMVIAEVDESDGYFRNIASTHAVVTNIEREHMEHYDTMENLLNAYEEFIGRISLQGFFVFNGEDPVLRRLADRSLAKTVSFGINGRFDFTCRDQVHANSIVFDLVVRGKEVGRISSSLIGRHNIMNILGATALCLEAGFDAEKVMSAIGAFRGVKRRFELVANIDGIKVIEDYAHHPTEIRAVIKAAKDCAAGKVIAVFQPHRYSRTRDLEAEFSECFYGCDVLVLTDIYSADEEVIEGVKIDGIYNRIDKSRFDRIELIPKVDIAQFISGVAGKNDMVIVLGAGDIREIAGDIAERIREGKRN